MKGDIVQDKKHIHDIRKDLAPHLEVLRLGLEKFISDHGFYPNIFYNENDINYPLTGIRSVIPDLDIYPGVFIDQDSPDTKVEGYTGIEFRTSINNTIRKQTGARQLLWTSQNLTHLPQLPCSVYDPNPSVQFSGTVVLMENGQIFPQQAPRLNSLFELGTSGLKTQIDLKVQHFIRGKFIEIKGTRSNENFWQLMQDHTYGFSVRGWGNWDFRFYELLASGRIPVHMDTDDELLFEREIPWDDLIVKVRPDDNIREKVEEFHSQFSDDHSLALHQRKLVDLYHEWLSFPAFCKHFEKYYEEELSC